MIRAGIWLAALAAVAPLTGCGNGAPANGPGQAQMPAMPMASQAAEANPNLDLGSSLGGQAAPDFRLDNQFGQPMSLSQFHGKVIILAFTDSQCTTVCPLTTASMLQARQLLGAAGTNVQLIGVNANPHADSVADVLAYSRAHGMVNQWDFLTGTDAQLEATWRAYHIAVQIQQGQIDHTPALFVIDQQGREQKIYLTQMAYSSVGQSAQVLAEEVASLLPGHPKLASQQSLATVPAETPADTVTLPAASGAPVTLGPGHPHLVLFFASWLSEVSDLSSELTGLNAYAQATGHGQLPPLTASRRDGHRALSPGGPELPERARQAPLSGRVRHHRPGRRRVRRPGPALVRPRLRVRQDPLVTRRLAAATRPGSRSPARLNCGCNPVTSRWGR